MPKPLVLVVEDDSAVRHLLVTALELNAYQCRSVESGLASISEALSYKPDAILLDLGLPDMDGLDILIKIRSWSKVPILVVSARSEDKDKITAFDAGADDYIPKPFSVDELMARLRACLRRSSYYSAAEENPSVFHNGALEINYAAGRAFLNQEELHLTPMEYKLLCLLAKNVGKVLTHQYLFQEVWGRTTEGENSHVRVFMASLRKKMDGANPGGAPYFQTHIGVGYRMVNQD